MNPGDQLADDLAGIFGVRLDDAEKDQFTAGVRYGDDGRWARSEVVAAPAVVLARQMVGLFLLAEQVLVISPDAADRFRQVRDLINGSELLRARVRRTIAVNGGERIDLDVGAFMRFLPPRAVRTGARGFSADLVTVHGETSMEQLEWIMPCLAGRANAQIWFAD